MAKKNVILFMIIYLVMNISCKSNLAVSNAIKYKVVSIDSIEDVYVIYAKNKSNYFKIVTQKMQYSSSCNKIKIGKKYKFDLVSLLKEKEKFRTNVAGVDFHGKSILLERDSITDIYSANNIESLCFVKKSGHVPN